MRVCRRGTIPLDVMNSPTSSVSDANNIANLIICAILRTVQLNCGIGLSSKRYICVPAQLHDLVSFKYPASALVAITKPLTR